MKALYILMFGLFSFAVHAQTSDNSIPPYYVDDVDCSGAMGQQGLMPSQIIGIEQLCAAMLSDEDGVANGKPSKHAEDIPVGAAASNGQPAMGDAIERSATSTQIAVTKPTIETSSEAKPDAADSAAIIGRRDAEDIPVGAAASNGEPAIDDAIEQNAMSTQMAATKPTIETSSEAKPDAADGAVITGPKGAEDIPVGAAASNGQPAMDDAIEQSATSTQMAVTKPTIETSSEATPDALDGAAIIGRRDAGDIPVGPVQPSEQNSSIKDSTAGDDELAVDDTNEQSATSTRIVATKPAIEHGQARVIEVDDVAITGPGYSQDVRATQVRKGQPTGAYSDQRDAPSRLDETIE
jgi:hypothetical protein